MPRTVNTRERLINSAIDLTAEYGIENVTVRRIAEMLGYSEATLYRHFGSRDELLEEAFITVDAKISSRFLDSPYVKEAPTDIIELIHRVWHDVYRYLLDNPKETKFLIRFRYSSLYSEVRERRKIYDGSFDEAVALLGKASNADRFLYKGFLPNYIFELTICFVVKVFSGVFPDTPETEEKLWRVIKAACYTLTGDK
ncbi:MAG: TetR/AcrR family transcriptional regulator [Firmicutes bacterium]|nr:TetR/AcrR family transcriptional regulator [Bacillota bacterium]MBQ1524023.1 TetR/AcrR family transcriptional regulator [Bacillota bacterium]MBQ1889004.1 TetR/AcrR family transcriptional regulator [Bacillota bacterium]MBQ2455877.1 TetR/AcrR family transcriptional regulator [Bacillota bacterium]MBQ3578732.1 TetR/AcrR family transcriptional regulator [Bacillota bacterium]